MERLDILKLYFIETNLHLNTKFLEGNANNRKQISSIH